MPQKILIVEDELSIQSILKELLTDAGYIVSAASDGVEGVNLFKREAFDLVLLDIMMPQLDGYGVCKAIREISGTPIVILTALDDEEAQIKAFELQVDDYITKPFSVKLVLLRIDAVLRRTAAGTTSAGNGSTLCYRDILLDLDGMEVRVKGTQVSLTRIEYELLRLFMEHPGRVFTRENLLNLIWGYDYAGDEKAVNIHIMNLRRKLGMDPIETIRGVVFKLYKGRLQALTV